MSNSLQTSHCNLQCGWQLLTSIACHNPRFSQKTPDYVPFPLTQGEKEKSRGAFLNCFFFFFFLLSVATTKYITHFSSTSNKTDPPSQHHCKLATSLQTMNLYTYMRVGSVGSSPFLFSEAWKGCRISQMGKRNASFHHHSSLLTTSKYCRGPSMKAKALLTVNLSSPLPRFQK